ncbi:MAG: hypothetical protein PUG10_07715, partial [Lachnospiraceae bacterium]|nr:hypothetical protein [Lachnospiraceae bacterium]
MTDSGASINGTTFLDKGILYAKDSISYNINSFATPSGSRVLIVSENGDININGTDININAVLYAPNGTVNINVNSLNLNGRIIAKNICMNGTLLNINAGPYDYDMVKFLYKPELEIATAGNLKENRKIDLDVVETTSTKFLNNCTAEWKITKLDCEDSSATYAVDETASTATHRELLFKESGTYTVEVTVKSKKDEFTVIKEIVIDKDVEPEAAFDISDKYFLRDEKGEVNLSLIDKSVSIDNDELVSRKWYVYYDADNNGEFEESEKKLFSDANKEAPNLTVNNVGKYKVRLEVAEGFTDTIESLIDDSVFKKGYAEDTFEVGNKKPTATVSLEKAKKADLVFTVGECSDEQLAIYNQKAEELRGVLEAQGVDARIETVSTKLLTAQDAFDWKEFTHTDYGYNHIKYTENGISMIGNYYYPVRDFLYVSSDNSGKKTFSFDLQRDRTDWHSMEGGGFLFNSTVDEANNTIKGFCVLAANGQLKLIKLDCKNLYGFRNTSYGMTQNAGQLLTSVPFSNVYDTHHLEVVVESNTVPVWDGDTLKIDSFVLPENDYGYGFGPITCHKRHCCSQLSYFTFNNIKMETMDGASLSDIVNGYDWRTDAERYVFNLSNKAVPELMTEEEIADTAAALLKTDTKFIGIGNENNENQYRKLINAIDGEGIYHSCEDLNSDMNDIEDIIVRAVNAKDYSIKDMITKDITVEYKS